MKQGHLINKINRLIPIANATPMSEFYDDDSTGIWIRGSVHPDLLEIIEEAGWFYEPYDAGTLMLYPNY